MANMYDTVKKQGEQLDGLQRKVTDNTERIATLETRSQATPPPQSAAAPEITVVVPDNVATKESLSKLLEKGLTAQTKITVKTVTEGIWPIVEKMSNPVIDEDTLEKVAQKCADKAFAKRYSKLEDAAERLNYRVRNLSNGTIWASIPRWFYIFFAVSLLFNIVFGYGFFYLLGQNDKLTEVEWLYRRERTLYKSEEELRLLLNHEREFLTGTPQEQDSIKNLIRHREHKNETDKTFLYFNPTEK